jgi:MOSC domain-containing protein YiiM
MNTINELKQAMPQSGRVEWIGVRPKPREIVLPVNEVRANEDIGLEGDHYSGKPGSKRQVTLILREHLDTVGSIMRLDSLDPILTRRNLVISGINLMALKLGKFTVGEVILEGTGNCAPCSRMEENLGPGGWNAMRGHGGITARVVLGGLITIGDEVKLFSE